MVCELRDTINRLFSKQLEPVAASNVGVGEFNKFHFSQFDATLFTDTPLIDEFVEAITNHTEKVLSLMKDEVIILNEVNHIHPASRLLLGNLFDIMKATDSTFNTFVVSEEFEFVAETEIDYNGKIDRGLLHVGSDILGFTWEDKSPKWKVLDKYEARLLYDGKTFRKTTNGKIGLAQAALQVKSQIDKLNAYLGPIMMKDVTYYGLLTSGIEWFVVTCRNDEWANSTVMMATVASPPADPAVDPEAIKLISKAIYTIFLQASRLGEKIDCLSREKRVALQTQIRAPRAVDRNRNDPSSATSPQQGAEGNEENIGSATSSFADLQLTTQADLNYPKESYFHSISSKPQAVLSKENLERLNRETFAESLRLQSIF